MLLLVVSVGFAQDARQGEVTFITANNVFVQFEGTANIMVAYWSPASPPSHARA
jgi:hypothetical protein